MSNFTTITPNTYNHTIHNIADTSGVLTHNTLSLLTDDVETNLDQFHTALVAVAGDVMTFVGGNNVIDAAYSAVEDHAYRNTAIVVSEVVSDAYEIFKGAQAFNADIF